MRSNTIDLKAIASVPGYAQRLTEERQLVNGREVLYVVDHDRREIRYSVDVTAVFRSAAALARQSTPNASRGSR